MRDATAWLVAAVALLLLTGCSSSFFAPPVGPVGTWTLAPDSASTIVVRRDHTFTAAGVPHDVACRHAVPTDRSGPCATDGAPVDVAGAWSLDERNPVELTFDDGDRAVFDGFRSGDRIGFWAGDRERPDPTCSYVRDGG